MRRPKPCDCHCETTETGPVTLKAFDKSTGDLVWEHWLENPTLSTDGYVWGLAMEEDDSAAADSFAMLPLSGSGSGSTLRIAKTTTITRYKVHIRKLNAATGATVSTSSLFWYTGNNGYTVHPVSELQPSTGSSGSGFPGWQADFVAVTSEGELLSQYGNFSTGTSLGEYILIWDSNNTTTTRRFTLLGAPVRDLATVPTGGTKLRFVCENDGTNAEQTIDVDNMIGKTAADLATALEAFPHIVSCTGTGGPYPLNTIELEIEWAQSTTHFKAVTRLTSTSRSVRTWLRDYDTGNITTILPSASTENSTADIWQLYDDDTILGLNGNVAASLGGSTGGAVERWNRSGTSFAQSWRVKPTSNRPPSNGGGSLPEYHRPAVRAGLIIVGHGTARGDDQATGESSEWHELNPTTGALDSNGGNNNRRNWRPTFASDSQLFANGWDSFLLTWTGSAYQCDRCPINYHSLMDGVSGVTATWQGAYGPYGAALRQDVVADTDALFCVQNFAAYNSAPTGSGWNADRQKVVRSTNRRIATVDTESASGSGSRVTPDSYFSLQNYYRVQHRFANPINHRWKTTGLEWRVAFFTSLPVLDSTDPATSTGWLAFTADATDLGTELAALLGNNTAGPNWFVEGPFQPPTGIDPLPTMLWQQDIRLTFPAEIGSPPPFSLSHRDDVRFCRIQIRSTAEDDWTMTTDGDIARIEWADGAVTWSKAFGASWFGGMDIGGYSGQLVGDNFIVYGDRVEPEL